ncbi:MAG: glycyl-radical enzyme activating protein, partial [Candidatus Dadabacteria bacterium]
MVDENGERAVAPIVSVQRASTEDGPGLRTTVFVKGCSLECLWCHNPEAVSPKPEVLWNDWRCMGSRACDAVCPREAISRVDGTVRVDRKLCDACGRCVEACPSTALELVGAPRTAEDVAAEVLRDRSYYSGGGGLTVSGGEPGLRPAFVVRLVQLCRQAGVHTAVDTCGMCSPRAIERIAEAADLILYDLKEMDDRRHRRFTGQSNERILGNFLRLAAQRAAGRSRAAIWIRTPLVPGATATEENVTAIGRFLSTIEAPIERWELCAFNNLARDKYRRLGRTWKFADTPLLSREELERLTAAARRS